MKCNQVKFIILATLIAINLACSSNIEVDPEAERKAILELHDAERNYHFNKEAEKLINLQSDDFVSVADGEIFQMSREDAVKSFSDYFSEIEFEAWDDIQAPIINFSDDYTVAYVIVLKKVIANYEDENGKTNREEGRFAWLSVYRKREGKWLLDVNVSTHKSLPNL